MADKTTNYELVKPLSNENYAVDVQNGNMDIIDAVLTPTADSTQMPSGNGPGKLSQWLNWLTNRIKAITGKTNWWDTPSKTLEDLNTHLADNMFQTAGGTATAITLTGLPFEDGYPKTFIASADNNGVATTVNSKPLYKPGTTTAPTLKSGKAYTIWYNLSNNCFFIKASATGTATLAQVLANVPYSNENETDLLGTMPDNPYYTEALDKWTNGLGELQLAIPVGAYLATGGFGAGKSCVKITDPNFIASNIPTGMPMLGLVGTATYIPITVSAGTNGVIAQEFQATTLSTTYVKAGEFKMIKCKGTVKLSFVVQSQGYLKSGWVTVYKNGVAISQEYTGDSENPLAVTLDIAFNDNDLIQIYAKGNTTSYQSGAFSISLKVAETLPVYYQRTV